MKELRRAMQSASQYLEAAGCWRKISKLSEKDMLVEDVLNFYLIIRLQLPLQRLVPKLIPVMAKHYTSLQYHMIHLVLKKHY